MLKSAQIPKKKDSKMHEYSVVTALLEQCDHYALESSAREIERVVVGIGEHSGIESALLQSAFETFKEESIYAKHAHLEIQIQPIMLACSSCGTSSTPEEQSYATCPKCASKSVRITQGRDMLLLRLEMLE